MVDRIDIGVGPRLGFDPTDTSGFKYVGQKELTRKEYGSRRVNFANEFLGLPSLGEESDIEVGAPEIGEDIAPPTSDESPSESEMLTSMLQGPMVSLGGGDFEKGDPDIKFGEDLLSSSHSFDKYSDYVREAPGLSDRVGLLEGIFEPLSTGKFKDLDFSVLGEEIKSEVKSGIQAVKDLPQTVLGAGKGDIKGKIEKGARKGFGAAFAVSGFPLSAIGSVLFSGQKTKNAFGETVPLASGPIGAATQLSLSRQYEIVKENKAAIAAGATDQGFMIKLPNGQYILREAGKETYFDNTGLSFKQKQELDGLSKGFLPDTYRASGKPGFLDFTTGFKRLEKANVGVVESGGVFTDSANPLKGFYTADGKYYTPGVGYSRFGNAADRNRLAQAQGISPERMQDLIEDARAGKGKLGDLIKAEKAEQRKQEEERERQRKEDEYRSQYGGGSGKGAGLAEDSGDSDDPRGDVGTTVAGLGGYSAKDYGGIFAQGGTVGMAAGGAMTAGMGSGFVDRPPSQVPESQTVADDVETKMPEGAFVINAAAVEFAGEQDIKKMLNDAQKEAVRRGITIDNSENSAKLIDVAISRGEVTVAPYLAKIIGYDRLNKINNRGKPETKERLQEAAQGGFLSAGYHVGGEVHAHDSMQADLELNVEDFFDSKHTEKLAAERQARKTQRNVDRANIAFGDMEAGFDLLNQYDWNNLLRSGLRDINLSNQTETEEDFILKSYGAGGMYQPQSDKILVGTTSKLTKGFATPRAQSHVFAHELMHRGAHRLENDAKFEAILKEQLSELEAFLKAGSELGTSQTRQNKEKRRTGTTSQHAYIYSVTGQSLVNRGGLDESGLTALIKRNFNFMTDDQQSNFIKSAGVIDNSPKNPKRRMQFLLDPELSREQLKELATRTNQLLMENAVTKAYEKRIADRPQEATPERQEEKVLNEARQN